MNNDHMTDEVFHCFMDRDDGDSPLLAAWALRFSIPFNARIEETAKIPLPLSWLKVIRSVENANMQDLLLLFMDKTSFTTDDAKKLTKIKKKLAEQYCAFMEEIGLPTDSEIRHHLQDVIRARFDMCVPDSAANALIGGKPYYSYDSVMNAIYQTNIENINATHLLFLLASAGIETCLPNLYLGKTYASLTIDEALDYATSGESPIESDQNICRLRNKFSNELGEYRTEILEMCSGAYDLIKANDYTGAERWAKFKAYTQIVPSVRRLEKAVATDSVSLAKRVAVGVMNGIPAIAQEIKPGGEPLKMAANELLKILVGAMTLEKKKYPLATYSCLLKKELSNGT